ncbi:hypothetical protein SAMN05443999_101225 [Roseovarius azorensis]|uniref:Uncharacterized protein n=1 Tax=Roseovarius azorensis TaxID=1287727 RepID=A0A1H7GB34_9RHOB|nr:hypothetical protein [Roseovarius azorensis]SEK33025.1 hypothetical protein SAMN05443999_101225 [Roseovarius azorensis]
MNRPFNTRLNTRVRACLYGARVLRRDRSRSACPGRGAFVVIGDVLGALALFAMLFVVASFGG